jgi:Sec7-like guanine-nucleotide exchange factor
MTSELYFRAETQELDRIIESFSECYFACNPSAVYGSPSA